MDIRIENKPENNQADAGRISISVMLTIEDIEQLGQQAECAYEIEQKLPPVARSASSDSGFETYLSKFVETRAVNDALESRDIVPVATPEVESDGFVEGKPFSCEISLVPRPEVGLTSLEPVDLATSRIPRPGFSAKAARDGSSEVEFIEDEKALRMAMVNRLDSELPEAAIRALAAEYQRNFELELAQRNIDPASYRLAHGLNEEQYDLMMARNALSDAHWNYALDAVFVGENLTITDDDILAAFELKCPGYAEDLLELYELRNELYLIAEKVRRGKALLWLKKNALN